MLVQVPPDLLTGLTDVESGQSQPVTDAATDTVADLLAEIAELRTALARSEAGLEAAELVRTAQVTALRELADRLTAELVAARRPWWRRLWSG
jgi:hypothetical protein